MSEFDDVTPLKPSDERITYRGPLKRLLISPEIGALIGAVVVWAFFWGNGDKFGTAGSTANFLDVAAAWHHGSCSFSVNDRWRI